VIPVLLFATFVLTGAKVHGKPEQISEWQWKGVQRIVALGDVHGAYEPLKSLLIETELVDSDLNWIGGEDHLVLCGDLTDRGPHDRAVLDLLIDLERQARKNGGRVHAVLGNHDVMNLVRDFRYVSEQSYADFAKDESQKERDRVWRQFKVRYAQDEGEDQDLQQAFEERYPPGFFSRIKAFGLEGKYGSWLIERPAVVQVNGVVFVHGGLTPEVAQRGIDGINRDLSASIRSFLDASEAISRIITLPPRFSDYFSTARWLEEKALEEGQSSVPKAMLSAARGLLAEMDDLPFSSNGPLWYRGNSLENERAERERVNKVLEMLDARAMMVGHTITQQRIPTTRFNRQVIRGDVGMAYGGSAYAVLFEGDSVKGFELSTKQTRSLMVEAPQGQGWGSSYEHLSDPQLMRILTVGQLVKRTPITRGEQSGEIWEMALNETQLRGVFKPVDLRDENPPRHYRHEIAAYRLDRMIHLDMVPVTVPRSVEEREGALRVLVESAVDLVSVRSYEGLEGKEREETVAKISERYGLNLDNLRKQVYRARLFDAIIGKPQRDDEDKLLMPVEGRVLLVDHEEAFPVEPSIDFMVPVACDVLEGDIELSLETLDRQRLELELGPYLDSQQITALLERRDRIFERCKQ
jgi:hypothetical protein